MAAPQKATKFAGPVMVGKDDGTAAPVLGTVPVVQRISLSALARSPAINLPACNIMSFRLVVETALTSGGNLVIGTSADDKQYAGVVSISAAKSYDITTTSGAAMIALASGGQVMANVSSQGSESAMGLASLYVTYMPLAQV